MNTERWKPEKIFVYRHLVDMRKQIQGLSNLVTEHLGRDPGDECLYVFSNKGCDKIKLLIWHRNGFWLLHKKLQKQRFQWPDWFNGDALSLTHEQFDQLIDDYNLNGMRPHKILHHKHAV